MLSNQLLDRYHDLQMQHAVALGRLKVRNERIDRLEQTIMQLSASRTSLYAHECAVWCCPGRGGLS